MTLSILRATSARERIALYGLAVVMVALGSIFRYFGMRNDLLSPVEPYVALYVVAFLFYFYAAVRLVPALKDLERYAVPIILVSGIVFRLMLVHASVSLSTDIYRYVWDGRLTCHLINPYRYAPFDARLAHLRDGFIWEHMEYKYYQTIYMPVSQLFFAVGYSLFGNTLWAYKLMYSLFDIGVMVLVLLILKQRGFPLGNVIWYAWCPLPITEVSLAGHQDPAGVFFLVFALYLALRSRPIKAGALIVAAGFTKGFAFLLLPLFIRRFGVRFGARVAVALALLGLPLWACFPEFLHGTSQYLATVHANSGLFYLINRLLIPIFPGSAFTTTARLCNLLVGGVLVWSVWTKPHSQAELIRRSVIVICACLMLTPTLFPWYVLWMLPLAVVQKPKPSYAVITLAGSVGLMYLYYINKATYPWIRALEYIPFYLLVIGEIRSGYWGELVFGRREDGDSLEEAAGPVPFSEAALPGSIGGGGLGAEAGAGDVVAVTGPAAAKY